MRNRMPALSKSPRSRLLALSTVVIAGCCTASADPPRGGAPLGQAGPATAPPRQPASPPPQGGVAGGQRPGGTLERVRYELSAYVARAELREDETLVADFGVPGGAKYSMGGWLTSTGDDAVLEETSVTLVPGTSAKLALPIAKAGAHTLVLRLKRMRPGEMTIYLNGRTIQRVRTAPPAGFEVLRVELPAEGLRVGENLLQLRAAEVGAVPGGGRASMALDWMRIGQGTIAETTPPTPGALAPVGERALLIPGGFTVGYATEVMPGARLRARIKGAEGTVLEVVAMIDGDEARPLASVQASSGGTPLDVDLATMTGKVVRFDLRARGGAATLERPAFVTMDGSAASSAAPTAPTRPRNVIIYLIDTLRADKLRPINPESRVETPGLSRLVEAAAVMVGARTQENWTKPSVATLLSSLLPWQHHAITSEAVVPAEVRMLPELLKDDGFHTGAFIANGYVSEGFGFRQGWNTFRNYVREGRRTRAQYLAADVLEWLDARPTDKPFFLYVHAIDPHVPYSPPDHFVQMYDRLPYTGVVDFTDDNELLEKIKSGRIAVNERDKARLEALYDGEISYHDVHFNSILDGLSRRGLDDDTMVVVTADHGEELWDHGSVGHGHSVYEELLHIPMIVRLPGVTSGSVRVPDAVGLVDVMPTVLEALGKEIPAEAAGKSFLPLLRGETPDAPLATVSGFMEGWRTVSVGGYKLIHRTIERMMVYHLTEDAREQRDLGPERPITVRYLRGMLGLALGASDGRAGRAAPRRVNIRQETTTIDPETEAQLRALGYVGSQRR